jgi:TrmH family RNA methyltransferase
LKPLSWYKALSDARGRRDEGFFIVEGRRAVEQVRTTAPGSIKELLVTGDNTAAFRTYPCPQRSLTERQFRSICSSKTPQGVAAVVKIPEKTYGDELPEVPGDSLLILEGIQDPGNAGTLVRTAAAFDYGGIILSESCADPFSPKAVQASAGSIMSLWVRRTGRYLDMVKELKRGGMKLIAADLKGKPLAPPCALSLPHALMLGSEAGGLSNEILDLADEKIRIPIRESRAQSLNVAVSGAMLMFYNRICVSQDRTRKKGRAGLC